jgi:hypothetical protein
MLEVIYQKLGSDLNVRISSIVYKDTARIKYNNRFLEGARGSVVG